MHFANRREMAQATGWFGRAARTAEDAGDCAERGYLLLPGSMQRLGAGEADEAREIAVQAADIGRRFGDADLVTLAVHLQGRALLRAGNVREGLALLDEAMTSVIADRLWPQVTGLVYCSVIGACREVWALDRASEWTDALAAWCDVQPDLVAYTGECRVYRAEILRRRGAWDEAFAEAVSAADRFAAGSEPDGTGFAFYQQAEVQRLRGEFAAAGASYAAADTHGHDPQPGLALLRLAQGEGDTAAATIRRALAGEERALRRARLLPACIDIMLATRDIEAAAAATDELAEAAELCCSVALEAIVAASRGAIELARGNAPSALRHLREAHDRWLALDALHEAASVRVLLGRACRAAGDEEGAMLQLRAAREVFERLRAKPDLARVDALIRPATARDHHGLTPRERDVLSLVATGLANRDVAERLCISVKTVERHMANIFARLGITSRSGATAYAWEHGLVEPS
jgi:DNA-binding NarL/FixJ family response regulator